MSTTISSVIAMCIVLTVESAAGQLGQGGVSNREVAASVPSEYKALYDGGIPTDQVSQVWAGFPYDSIELERTACFGTCPVYRVSLFKGGKAELHRIRYTDPVGDFEGTVSVFDYGKLCYLVKRLGFDELPARYAAGWTDSPTFIVTATAGKTRKVVSDYAGVGPIELWAVQQAVDAVAQRVRWTPK
jgi:hypothetical protein